MRGAFPFFHPVAPLVFVQDNRALALGEHRLDSEHVAKHYFLALSLAALVGYKRLLMHRSADRVAAEVLHDCKLAVGRDAHNRGADIADMLAGPHDRNRRRKSLARRADELIGLRIAPPPPPP